MHVLAIANTKGGSGKTTLALHLGVEAERAGNRVVWLDLDPQASLTEAWEARVVESPSLADLTAMTESIADSRLRRLEKELQAKLEGLAGQGYDLAILDTPPEHYQAIHLDAGLVVADAILVPIQPTPLALRAVGPLLAKLGAERRFIFVINDANPNIRVLSTHHAIAELSAHGRVAPVILHRRELYASATADGRTAGELVPNHAATREIRELWRFVDSWLRDSTISGSSVKTDKRKGRA
jgi:chromosome partitioning protein